jgi:hypothetical protein
MINSILRPFIFTSLFILLFANVSGNNPGTKISKKQSISFTENKGQVCDQFYRSRRDVLYGVTAGDLAVHIKSSGVSYQLSTLGQPVLAPFKGELPVVSRSRDKNATKSTQTIYRIDLNWLGAKKNFLTLADEALPGYSNFYMPSCPMGALFVRSYAGVTLKDLYPGIDLHYYDNNGDLKHDYVVAPHSNYKQIQLQVDGAGISVNKDGSLLLHTPLGTVQEGAPLVFQNGKQLIAKWLIKNNVLSFEIEKYDPNEVLIIDPITRLWGTYYGGPGTTPYGIDVSTGCTTDKIGNIIMCGYTTSSTSTLIATIGSYQSTTTTTGDMNGYFVKFNPNGSRIWGTYFGGAQSDQINSCAVDTAGNIVIAGTTSSYTNIASPGSHQTNYVSNDNCGFLGKFDANGVRQWSTYYGGVSSSGNGCCTDVSGNVYICGSAGYSNGTLIATPGSHQFTTNAGGNGYLAKFDPAGVRLWGTYYGESFNYVSTYCGFSGNACCTDATGNVFLTGTYYGTGTNSLISTPGCHQPVFGGTLVPSGKDALLVKFTSGGTRLWATYYGSQGDEEATSCVTDSNGNIYMGGYAGNNIATGTIIATPGAHQVTNQGYENGFLVKFNSSGTRQWGTYYGGGSAYGGDRIADCAIDAFDNVYFTGQTETYISGGSPSGTAVATVGCYQDTLGGFPYGLIQYDAYLAKFNSTGQRVWGTFYGGPSGEVGCGCATDLFGHVFLCGNAGGSTLRVASPGSFQSSNAGGNSDAFLVKFDQCTAAPAQPLAFSGPSLVCSGKPATFYTPPAYAANFYTLTSPGNGFAFSYSNTITISPLTSGVFTLVAGNACGASPQQTLFVNVTPSPTLVLNSGAVCPGQSFTIVASGASTYTYSSGPIITPSSTNSYTVAGTNTLGCSNYSVTTITVNPNPVITVNSGSICLGQSFTINAAGAFTYTYSSGTNIIAPASNTVVNVTGTSAFGCVSSNTATSTVFVNPLPALNVVSTNPQICAGEAATLHVSGAVSYSWDSGVSGDSLVISPGISTTYTISGTDANGCTSSATFFQGVDACLGISQTSSGLQQGGFKLYPNPAEEIIYIELGAMAQVRIVNTIGQYLFSETLRPGVQLINTADWAKGIYLISSTNQSVTQNGWFIKN